MGNPWTPQFDASSSSSSSSGPSSPATDHNHSSSAFERHRATVGIISVGFLFCPSQRLAICRRVPSPFDLLSRVLPTDISPPIPKRASDKSLDLKEKKKSQTIWKTEGERLSYSSKLLEALRHVLRNLSLEAPAPAPSPSLSRAVREAADLALAMEARGRSRWSRAILSSRPGLMRKAKKKKALTWRFRSSEAGVWFCWLPQRRVRTLRRLVPGCRKVSIPILVDEAVDYIAALEMQVRAMRSLAELLSGLAAAANQSGSASTAMG